MIIIYTCVPIIDKKLDECFVVVDETQCRIRELDSC